MNIVQHKNKIDYWKKGRERNGSFVALSNFAIKLLKHVSAPPQFAKEVDFVQVTQERAKSFQGKNIIYVPVFALESKWICER